MDLDSLLDDVEQLLEGGGEAGEQAKGRNTRPRSQPSKGSEQDARIQRLVNGKKPTSSMALHTETTSAAPTARHPPSKPVASASNKAHGRAAARTKPSSDADVDSLLSDLESTVADAPASSQRARTPNLTSSQGSSCSIAERGNNNGRPTKCTAIVLTDSKHERGVFTSAAQHFTCSTLRCTSCDHSVCCFDDVRWDDKVDYLFFRNNTPDYDKLKVLLRSQPGGRAYACQCSWASVTGGERQQVTRSSGAPKWVCGRHLDA